MTECVLSFKNFYIYIWKQGLRACFIESLQQGDTKKDTQSLKLTVVFYLGKSGVIFGFETIQNYRVKQAKHEKKGVSVVAK